MDLCLHPLLLLGIAALICASQEETFADTCCWSKRIAKSASLKVQANRVNPLKLGSLDSRYLISRGFSFWSSFHVFSMNRRDELGLCLHLCCSPDPLLLLCEWLFGHYGLRVRQPRGRGFQGSHCLCELT